jgi:hypothetical protein
MISTMTLEADVDDIFWQECVVCISCNNTTTTRQLQLVVRGQPPAIQLSRFLIQLT